MDTPPSAPAATSTAAVSSSEDKTVAIVSYLTLIGFIVAVVLHGNKKTELGAFHLRQVLGIFLTGVCCWFVNIVLAFIPIVGWLAIFVIWIGLLVFWLMGLIAAAGGHMKPVPLLGEHYQKWFANTFK